MNAPVRLKFPEEQLLNLGVCDLLHLVVYRSFWANTVWRPAMQRIAGVFLLAR
jgi:hypothetical protein